MPFEIIKRFCLMQVHTRDCDTVVRGIQFGLLGNLSTVSTFAAEFNAMRESNYPWRAYAYAIITIFVSFAPGILFYCIPVWTRGFDIGAQFAWHNHQSFITTKSAKADVVCVWKFVTFGVTPIQHSHSFYVCALKCVKTKASLYEQLM